MLLVFYTFLCGTLLIVFLGPTVLAASLILGFQGVFSLLGWMISDPNSVTGEPELPPEALSSLAEGMSEFVPNSVFVLSILALAASLALVPAYITIFVGVISRVRRLGLFSSIVAVALNAFLIFALYDSLLAVVSVNDLPIGNLLFFPSASIVVVLSLGTIAVIQPKKEPPQLPKVQC